MDATAHTPESAPAGTDPTGEVWILGATGRIGRPVAARLLAQGLTPVLVGRDSERLHRLREDLGRGADVPLVVADGTEAVVAEIGRRRPAVVVNTLGGYGDAAVRTARACMPGGHYLDLANDLTALPRLFALQHEAVDAGSSVLTGVGFGVLATEAVVVSLCEGRPTPDHVRVDALASVGTEAGVVGEALAGSLLDGLAIGGRRYRGGRLVGDRIGADPQRIALPDGESVTAAGISSGELLAAQRASGALSVTAASNHAPTGRAARLALPLLSALVSPRPVRRPALRG
ncbi:hypothetical protein G3I40_39850, partial [Streptomyces sp. SID14478]|uniref:hypothetical protein n=1 Tax=Streptomyces sp. SID14478 TaxID=2706073 RepID=UPI0013DEF91F